MLSSTCFFFQAEDGIRDLYVTGVQTCALPIYGRRRSRGLLGPAAVSRAFGPGGGHGDARARAPGGRSEERRVGKECRSRRTSSTKTNKQVQTVNAPSGVGAHDLLCAGVTSAYG